MSIDDIDAYMRMHGCNEVFGRMLNKYGVADLLHTFAEQIEQSCSVPGSANIGRDLKRFAEELPSIAWRNP